MPYTYLTFASAVQTLASRLSDPNQTYWNQPSELLNCVIESVRLHQCLTGSYKQKIAIATVANQVYYDLSLIPALASVAGYNVTDVEVANNVLASLIEPPLPSTGLWKGTGQFTINQLRQSIQNRLNRFIGDTGCRVTQQTINGPAAPADLAVLPDGVMDVRRVGWMPPVAIPPANPPLPVSPLGRLDEWAEQAYIPAAQQNPGQPYAYSTFQDGPLQIRMVPPPLSSGQVDCLLVVSGPQVNLAPMSPVVLQIPDDLSPALKWGTLADLLGSDGPSRDYARAAYCEARYREYIAICRLYPSVLTCDINNTTAGVGSVFDMDYYMPDWQQTQGTPSFIGMCGRNMACIGQTPDGVYGIGMWVCANAPTTGFMQVARDQIDPVIDYAQHIASFKMGGAEFDGTDRLRQNMIQCAKNQNGRLNAVSFYRAQIEQPAMKSEYDMTRMVV